MLILDGIRALPSQLFRVPIGEGQIKITLNYKPAVEMWFIDVEFGDFEVKGVRVCRNYNLLQQYSRLIPFGIYIQMDSELEPTLIDDFSSGRVVMNILTEDEKEEIEGSYQVR